MSTYEMRSGVSCSSAHASRRVDQARRTRRARLSSSLTRAVVVLAVLLAALLSEPRIGVPGAAAAAAESPLLVSATESVYQVTPLFALADVTLNVSVTGVQPGDSVQLWTGANACPATPSGSSSSSFVNYSSVEVVGRRTVPAGATAVTVGVPACCTPSGALSVCVRHAGGVDFELAANVVLSRLHEVPATVTIDACRVASSTSSAPPPPVQRLTIVPGSSSESAALALSSSSPASSSSGSASANWTPLPGFCADASCNNSGSSSTSDVAAVTTLAQLLNASFAYWSFADSSGAPGPCLPASEALDNPDFFQATLSVEYKADVMRYWVYADVVVPAQLSAASLMAGSADGMALRTCVAPIASASTGSGSEYTGHTSAGILTVSIGDRSACSSSSSSDNTPLPPVPPTSSSSSSSSSSTVSSASSSSSEGNASSSGFKPSPPSPSSSGAHGGGSGSSDSEGGLYTRHPYPTSAIKGQTITIELQESGAATPAALSLRAWATSFFLAKPQQAKHAGSRRVAGGGGDGGGVDVQRGRVQPLADTSAQEERRAISVIAADPSCRTWLSVPSLLSTGATFTSRHTIPTCGAAAPDEDGGSDSSSGSADAAVAALVARIRAQGTYGAVNSTSLAYFCVAYLPDVTLSATSSSSSSNRGEEVALSWHELGELQLITLYNCTTHSAVGIVAARVRAATPLRTAADFGVTAGITSGMPWLSAAGGTAGCAAAAASSSFAAVQSALQTQGYLTPEGASPSDPFTPTFFVCARSADSTLIFTTAAPTLTVGSFTLQPLVGVWGVQQGYTLLPRAVLPLPAQSYFTFTSANSSGSSKDGNFTIRVSAAAVASGNTTAPVLLGNGLDSAGTEMTSDMIGFYRVSAYGTAITITASALAAQDVYVPVASLVVLRPPEIVFTSYTESGTGVEVAVPAASTSPTQVPAGARVCGSTSVPGDLYSQVPGEDSSGTSATYAAYQPYYYPNSSTAATSSEAAEAKERGMYLMATTPAAWVASQAANSNPCASASPAGAVVYVNASDRSTVCFSTSGLASGPPVLYVVCAGTPAGPVAVPTTRLSLVPTVTVSPAELVGGSTAEVYVPQLPSTSFIVVPTSIALLTSSTAPTTGAGSSSSSSGAAEAAACAALTKLLAATTTTSSSSSVVNRWPHFATNATGYGTVSLVETLSSTATAPLPSGTYATCYWWPDLPSQTPSAAATTAAVASHTRRLLRPLAADTSRAPFTSSGGTWMPASTIVRVYDPVYYSLSASAIIAPLTSTVVLRQNLSAAVLLPGLYNTTDCTTAVPSDVASWERVPLTGAAASTYDAREIEVTASHAMAGSLYLCARAPVNDSLIALPPSGLRIAAQPLLIPATSADAAVPTCAEFDLFFEDSAGLVSGTYTRNVGATVVRAAELANTTLADLAGDDATAAGRVYLTLSIGPCCATADGSATLSSVRAYGVWVRAGAMGYLLNESTLRAAATVAGAEVRVSGADVSVRWSVCLMILSASSESSGGGGSADGGSTLTPAEVSNAQCTTAGHIWVGTANSLCDAEASASGVVAGDVAGAARATVTTTAAASTSSASPEVLPLLASLAATRANIFSTLTLPTTHSRRARLAIVAGAVLCGVVAVFAPLVAAVVVCVGVRRRRDRLLMKAVTGAGLSPTDAHAICQRTKEEPSTAAAAAAPTADAPTRQGSGAGFTADTATPGTGHGEHRDEHHSDGEMIDLNLAGSPLSSRLVSAAHLRHSKRSSARGASAGSTRLTKAELHQIEAWLLAPSLEGQGDYRIDLRLDTASRRPSVSSSSASAFTNPPQPPQQRNSAQEEAAAPSTTATAAAASPLAITATAQRARPALKELPLGAGPETADRAVSRGSPARATSPSPSFSMKTPTLPPPARASSLPSSRVLLTLDQLAAAETAARSALSRAEEADIIAVLERQQRDWLLQMRGEGVRLQSLLRNDPYWAPRLAELEAVNRRALAEAQQQRGDEESEGTDDAAQRFPGSPSQTSSSQPAVADGPAWRDPNARKRRSGQSTQRSRSGRLPGHGSTDRERINGEDSSAGGGGGDGEDSGLMTALSDSVMLFPIPRAVNDVLEPANTSMRERSGHLTNSGSVFSDRSAGPVEEVVATAQGTRFISARSGSSTTVVPKSPLQPAPLSGVDGSGALTTPLERLARRPDGATVRFADPTSSASPATAVASSGLGVGSSQQPDTYQILLDTIRGVTGGPAAGPLLPPVPVVSVLAVPPHHRGVVSPAPEEAGLAANVMAPAATSPRRAASSDDDGEGDGEESASSPRRPRGL